MSSFAAAVARIKGDVARAVPAALIRRAADAIGITGRNRVLTPAVTTHLAVRRCRVSRPCGSPGETPRFEPRVKKRRPKQFPRMTRPRTELKRELRKQLAA